MLLGTALSHAKHSRASGIISLKSNGQNHHIQFTGGNIMEMAGPEGAFHLEHASQIFSLPRPLIHWEDHAPLCPLSSRRKIDPAHLLVKGVTFRRDLFEPTSFVERVPVSTLSIDSGQLIELKKLPFSQEDILFFKRLTHPTPISMILWKRGVSPKHAASLLATLNMLGVWKGQWAPGVLPKISSAQKIMRRRQHQVDDLALLGLPLGADAMQIDRAFRQLSFELHPDRLAASMNTEDRKIHHDAFDVISAAYTRLKRTRTSRRQPLVTHRDTSLWQGALQAAEAALQQGNIRLAKKHALTGLSLSPPAYARNRFAELLKIAA